MAKVVLIGCGAVGSSFLYSAINQGIANEYGLIDAFEGAAIGNQLDLEDAIPSLARESKVYVANYDDLRNVDYIMISAGRPQKPGETRLEMIKDNLKIIEDISKKIKTSGFEGITFICANPVDILTYAYIKYTGFDPKKVIGSGTALDTARLKVEISKGLNISPSNVDGAYVIGEHGDSSVTVFSNIKVNNKSVDACLKGSHSNSPFCGGNYEEKLEKFVAKKAYSIIEKKRATFYGIGAAMAKILKTVIEDKNEILVVGSLLNGEYGYKDIVMGVPCIINKSGIFKVVELGLNEKEKTKLEYSYNVLKKIVVDSLN